MNKKVNGKIIDIKNIEIFEKAFEGLAVIPNNENKVSNLDGIDLNLFNSIINNYSKVYMSLPFPLNSVEENIKYAIIGDYIKNKVEGLKETKFWADRGLYVAISDDKALKFIRNTWSIIRINNTESDNTDLELYKESIGYIEFKWAANKLRNNKSLGSFYTVFMREFVEACNKEPSVIKWELTNLLNFNKCPERLILEPNTIINIASKSKYILDIYSDGKIQTNARNVYNLVDNSVQEIYEHKIIYNFELYEKKLEITDDGIEISRLNKEKYKGIASLFEKISGKFISSDELINVEYSGFTDGNKLIFCIDNIIYEANLNEYNRANIIDRNCEIYAYKDGVLYILRKYKVNKGIYKEEIYAYNLNDNTKKLCSIRYIS